MYSFTKLDITGHGGEAIPNSYLQHEEESSHLAIIFPGLGYNASMPLLYYTARLLLHRGADVLLVEYDYNTPEMAALPREELLTRLFANSAAAFDVARGARSGYQRITLVGKSLGTIGMAHLLTDERAAHVNDWIWMTPMLGNERFCTALAGRPHRGLVIAGSGDRHYDPEGLARIAESTGGASIIIEGADHSMEIEDVAGSIDIIREVVEGVRRFIA